MMRQVDGISGDPLASPTSIVSGRSSSRFTEPKEAALVPLPLSPGGASSSSSVEPIPPPKPAASLTDITDLLDDSAPAMTTAPIEPSPSPSVSPKATSPFAEALPISANGTKQETEPDSETTVRLVGGGGTSGIVAESATIVDGEVPQAKSTADDDAETASVTSVASTGSLAKVGGKHEKKKSIPGLKKLGQLAGKRRKDSSSSLKQAV